MLLPIIEPNCWSRLFKSQLVKRLQQNTMRFFYLLLGVLTICLASAYLDTQRFSQMEEKNAQMKFDIVRENHFLKAQRNLYISGFAIFLIMVLKRIIALISIVNQLLAQSDAAIKQAQSASKAAESMIDEKLNKNMQETTDDNKQEEREVSKEKQSQFVLDCLLNLNIYSYIFFSKLKKKFINMATAFNRKYRKLQLADIFYSPVSLVLCASLSYHRLSLDLMK